VRPSKEVAAPAAAQPILLKNGGSHHGGKSSGDAPAPNVNGIAAAGNNTALSNLAASTSAPAPVLQAMSVSQGVSRGLLVKSTQPTYPASALRLRIQGPVELLATISKSGDISAVKVLSGDETLAHAAVAAVKQWKYKPYLLNGEPVEIQTEVTVKFKLPR
jgi:protein TonB